MLDINNPAYSELEQELLYHFGCLGFIAKDQPYVEMRWLYLFLIRFYDIKTVRYDLTGEVYEDPEDAERLFALVRELIARNIIAVETVSGMNGTVQVYKLSGTLLPETIAAKKHIYEMGIISV